MTDTRRKIGTMDEFKAMYDDEWLLLEVMETSELDEPSVGRMIAHSPLRDEIMKELRGSNLKDVVVLFSGDIPKKGTLLLY